MNLSTTTVCAVAGGSAALIASLLAPSSASAATPAVTQAARTCAAFRTWDAHRTTAHLRTVMADSLSLAWKGDGLSGDVYSLYGDVSARDGYYVSMDVRYIGKDCRA